MQELKEMCAQWVNKKKAHEDFTVLVEAVPVIGNPHAMQEVFVDFINKDGGYTITVKLHGNDPTVKDSDERSARIKAELQCSSTTGYDAVLAYAELPQKESAVSDLLDYVHQCLQGDRGFSDIKKSFLVNTDGKISVEPCPVGGLPANNDGGLKTYNGDAASVQLIVEDALWEHNSCMRRNDTKMFVDPWTGAVFVEVSPKTWDGDKSPRPVLIMRVSECEEDDGGKAVQVDAAVKNTGGVGISNATQVDIPKKTGCVYSIIHDMVKLFNKAVCIAVNDDEGPDVAAAVAEYIGMKSRAHFVALTKKIATVRITNANVLFGTIRGELFTSFAMGGNTFSCEYHQVKNWIQEFILDSSGKTARIQAVPFRGSAGKVALRSDTHDTITNPTIQEVRGYINKVTSVFRQP